MFSILPHISYITFSCSLGFVCGVLFGSFFVPAHDTVLFVSAITVFFVFIFGYKKRAVWVGIIFILLFALGFFVISEKRALVESYSARDGERYMGVATVVKDVEQKTWYSHVYVQYEGDDFLVLLKDEKHTSASRGDIIDLSCTLKTPENHDDFDYRSYLAMRNAHFICDDMSYSVAGHKSSALGVVSRVRATLEGIVNTIIPAPESALANGLLFGGSSRLSEDLQEKFAQTGMTHIVAVSGYNVSIIIAVVISSVIFIGVHRRYAVYCAVVAVVLFVALIDFPSSGIRAAIMGILVLIAASYGRVTHAYSAIIVSAAVMLFFNPLILRYDVGFQLSFLATLGIVAVYPIFERYFVVRNAAFGITEVLLLTLSAQVFVLPVIVYHFHTLSTISLLVNILVLPIIPFTMFFVFFLIVASHVFYPVAVFSGWIAYFLLAYEVRVIAFFSDLSFSSIAFEHVSVVWIALYYIVVCAGIFYLNRKMQNYA